MTYFNLVTFKAHYSNSSPCNHKFVTPWGQKISLLLLLPMQKFRGLHKRLRRNNAYPTQIERKPNQGKIFLNDYFLSECDSSQIFFFYLHYWSDLLYICTIYFHIKWIEEFLDYLCFYVSFVHKKNKALSFIEALIFNP